SPGRPRVPHSFPTRRSSDLPATAPMNEARRAALALQRALQQRDMNVAIRQSDVDAYAAMRSASLRAFFGTSEPPFRFMEWLPLRSEEHTSELQSRRDLVCRL